MEYALLIDFGSTFTKITFLDLKKEKIIVTRKTPTKIESDIMNSLNNTLRDLDKSIGIKHKLKYSYKLACSSAAGGLRLVAIGLIPELTVEAAKRAALGSGAKLIGAYGYELDKQEMREIEFNEPDIILLVGGTDGGDKKTIIHNANFLANSSITSPIIVAGNKKAIPEIKDILLIKNKYARFTENVMPFINTLNIEPVRKTIRDVFMENIIYEKGLKQVKDTFIDGILIPTPVAVLNAVTLLAEGTDNENGLGEMAVVDVGGATTDIYSVSKGTPSQSGVVYKGLPEPYAKRSVEGDLGVRHNAHTILEVVKKCKSIEDNAIFKNEEETKKLIEKLTNNPVFISTEEPWITLDFRLALTAAQIAMDRHVGHIEEMYTPFGPKYVQFGKDLSQIKIIVGTGGPIVYSHNPIGILSGATFSNRNPFFLKPINPSFIIDNNYIMYAIGLLAEVNPDKAIRIFKKTLNL